MSEQSHLPRTIESVRLLSCTLRGERSVLVVVRLRHLNESDPIRIEVAEDSVEELGEWDVIGIEDENEILCRHLERAIDLACFRSRDIDDFEPRRSVPVRQIAEHRIAGVIEQIRFVRIRDSRACGQGFLEHRQRLARGTGGEDRDAHSRRRSLSLRLSDREIVHPAEHHSSDAVPHRDAERCEKYWLPDVIRTKPPVDHPDHSDEADSGECAEHYPVARTNVRRLTACPHATRGWITSAQDARSALKPRW